MSRSHRVWNDIRADNYANPQSKSFGGEFTQRIAVGSSASYSNPFATVEVREIKIQGTDWSTFVLYVDGLQIKRAVFNNKTKVYQEIALDTVVLTVIEVLEA